MSVIMWHHIVKI